MVWILYDVMGLHLALSFLSHQTRAGRGVCQSDSDSCQAGRGCAVIEVKDALNDQHILLSIAAGVTIATIESVCMLRLMMSVSALLSSVIALVCE